MDPIVPKFPNRVEIELVSDCNLRCTYCPRHYVNDLKGYIDFDLFKKIVREMEDYPETIIVLHRRGESLLHPKISEMLDMVAGKFLQVQMATNATLLTKDKFSAIVNGLTFLSFSMDTPENYNKTRIPAKYKKVEAKILEFLDYNNGRISTQVSMVKTDATSEKDCTGFLELWKDRVDRVRIYEEHSSNGKFGSLANPRQNRKPCVMPFYELLVYDNGTIGRCNHDWASDGRNSMGNANAQTLADIWHGQAYSKLRQEQLSLSLDDPICSQCDCWYPEIGNQGTGDAYGTN